MTLALLCVVTALGGCATKPESVLPAYVSEFMYQNLTCEQLAQEQARVQVALMTAAAAQRTARTHDTVGVIFLGLPVSSLSGSNQAAQIAQLKGQLEAIDKAAIQKGCKLPVLPDPMAEPKT